MLECVQDVLQPPGKKMGDFDSCRFDFRIDNKSGLTPSRRKKAEKRNCNYNTLFKCKTCGNLFESRPALLEHKLLHNDFRCTCCEAKYTKYTHLEDHMLQVHGIANCGEGIDSHFVKIAPKSTVMSPPHDDDEIVTYPSDMSPPAALHASTNMPVFAGMPSPDKSPVNSSSKEPPTTKTKSKSAIPSDLPPLIPIASIGSATNGTSSPSLPSSSLISAAVANVFKSVIVPKAQNTTNPPVSSAPAQISPASGAKDQLSSSKLSPTSATKSAPKIEANVSPGPPPLVSPPNNQPQPVVNYNQLMSSFPQVRYAFPQMIPVTAAPATPSPVTNVTTPTTNNTDSKVSPPASTATSFTPTVPVMLSPIPQMPIVPSDKALQSPNAVAKTKSQVSPSQPAASTPQPAASTDAPPPSSSSASASSSSETPSTSTTTTPTAAAGPPPLPPGYVYINVPMMITPGQPGTMHQMIPPQMLPQMMMHQLMPQLMSVQPPTQPAPSNDASQGKQIPLQPKQELVTTNGPQKRRHENMVNSDGQSITAPPTKSRRKRKNTTPQQTQPSLVIQDPRSMTSTDFEKTGSIIKIEPTSPQEIDSQALDFTFKPDPHPVRYDVNFSAASNRHQDENPLNNDAIIDLSNTAEEEMEFTDDKAAMLDQYRHDLIGNENFEDAMVPKLDSDTRSRTSSRDSEERSTPKNYACDQCEFKAANGALLSQHKAKAHKVAAKTGLNKLLGKLWQNKMKKPEVERDPEPEEPVVQEPAIEPLPVLPDPVDITPETFPLPQTEAMTSLLNFEVQQQPDAKSAGGAQMFKFHTCKVCKQLFDNVNAMWEHMAEHQELRKFKCNLCSFKAVCRDRLTAHKQAEHPEYVKNPWSKPSSKQQTSNSKKGQHQSRSQAMSNGSNVTIPCSVAGCNASFNTQAEQGKHQERVHTTLQCPEEGCGQMFFTVGGLKNHQMSHLETASNASSEASLPATGPYKCTFSNCGKEFKEKRNLKSHISMHTNEKFIHCSMCTYQCKHRNALIWHMKTKHGLQKAKGSGNKSVYMDSSEKVVYEGGDEVADGVGEMTPVPSPTALQQGVQQVMQTSMPDEHQRFVYNNIGLTNNPADVISYDNEPEEIAVGEEAGDSLTVEKLAMHDQLKEEAVDDFNENGNDSDEQPLDMSVKKSQDPDAASEVGSCTSAQSSSLDLSQYSGEVIRTLGALPSGYNTPSARSTCSTPVHLRECTLEIDSISSPTEDMSHFTSVLKFKPSGGSSTKEKKKSAATPIPSKFYNCKVCSAQFDDAEKMWEHRIKEHGESTKFYCDTCGFDCNNKEDLQNHMLSTHGKELGNFKAFICFICGKGYGTKSGLNHHMLRHSEEGPPTFPCPYPDCQSKLHSKGSLKMHIRRQHNNQPCPPNQREPPTLFRCEYAGCKDKTFGKEDLQSHMLSMHGKELGNFKTYACMICGKGYGTKSGLTNHYQQKHNHPSPQIQTNETEKVFKCQYAGCDKTFGTSKHLKVHHMQHTGEMPLRCHLCDYACRQRNSMNWHMKSKHGLEKRVTEDGRQTYYV